MKSVHERFTAGNFWELERTSLEVITSKYNRFWLEWTGMKIYTNYNFNLRFVAMLLSITQAIIACTECLYMLHVCLE